jgi:two-component system KDP operon response regulator KdpE
VTLDKTYEAQPIEGGLKMTGMSVAQEAAIRARLLVVDDDEGVLNFLRRVLTSEGFEVTLANSVSDARAAIKTDLPELVVLDLGLADDDGLELLAELRSDTDVPVIVLTGRAPSTIKLGRWGPTTTSSNRSPISTVARIDTVLAFVQRTTAAPRVFGPDCDRHHLREVSKDGRPIETTARESDLLAFLTAPPRQVSPGSSSTGVGLVGGVAGPRHGDRTRAPASGQTEDDPDRLRRSSPCGRYRLNLRRPTGPA